MRHRLANLEQVVAERDRLRMQIADMRHTDSPGVVGAAAEAAPVEPDPSADAPVDPPAVASAEPDVPASDLDLDAARSTVGKRIRLDDLTVVEGIGPKIAELCSGIGIITWRGLGRCRRGRVAVDARRRRVPLPDARSDVVARTGSVSGRRPLGRLRGADRSARRRSLRSSGAAIEYPRVHEQAPRSLRPRSPCRRLHLRLGPGWPRWRRQGRRWRCRRDDPDDEERPGPTRVGGRRR